MPKFGEESRYKGAEVTQVENEKGEKEDFVDTREKMPQEDSTEDKFTILGQEVAFRPDLVSKAFYGTPAYGWAIMEANNLMSFVEMKTGVKLKIPPKSKIKEFTDKKMSTFFSYNDIKNEEVKKKG